MKFISLIWGYHRQLYSLSPIENYHLHSLKVAKDMGYKPVAFIFDSTTNIEGDPNFDKEIEVIYYSNFFSYLYFLWLNRKNIFYANTFVWKSLIVCFFGRKTIFMGHDSVIRKNIFKQMIQDCLFKLFNRIRVVTEEEKKFLISRGIAENKIFVVPIAIDIDSFTSIVPTNRANLLFLGNVTPDKNIGDILRALNLVKRKGFRIKLEIIGEIRDDYFYNLINDLELQNDIILHGFVAHHDLVRYLNHTLIYVNSSISEGQCLAAYESALAGNVLCLPKTLSFVGIFKDCALFHDLYDFERLASNIINYLENRDLVSLYNDGAKQFIINNYNSLVIGDKMKKVFLFT